MTTERSSIIYIDDQPANRETLAMAFDDLGVGVIQVAASGEEGLDLITTETRLVIADYDLGAGMDGIAVLKAIIEEIKRHDIYRVLHSSYVGQEPGFNNRAADECAPHILLPKPFQLLKFIDDVRSLLTHGVRTDPDE